MIRRIMQVEIEEEPDFDGEVRIRVRNPRTGEIVHSFYGDPEEWLVYD